MPATTSDFAWKTMIRFLLGSCVVLFLLVALAFTALLVGGPVAGAAALVALPVLLVLGAVALPLLLVLVVAGAVLSVVGALLGAGFSLALLAVKVLLFVVAPIALLGYLAVRFLAA